MKKGLIMNNQYNGQPAPQQPTPPQQNQQPTGQQNYQQPILQNPSAQYAPPPKPYVDPAAAKKKKTDAINNLGDKVAEALNANPILAFIEKNSAIYSYIATGASAVLTILAMVLANFTLVFSFIAVIFGFFALSKKKVLPLAAALSVLTLFSLISCIGSFVMVVQLGDLIQLASYISSDGALAGYVGGGIVAAVFGFIETAAVGFLAYCAWDFYLASSPANAPMQQPQYYNNQPMQQPAAPQQTAPAQAPVQQSAPVQQAAPAVKYCSACGTKNTNDALFCRSCGRKFE